MPKWICNSSQFRNLPAVFLFRRIKICFALQHFAAFSTFGVKYFWPLQASFILLKVLLNSSCLGKQSKMNGVIKKQTQIFKRSTGWPLKPNFRCPLLEVCSFKLQLRSLMLIDIANSPRILLLNIGRFSNNKMNSK